MKLKKLIYNVSLFAVGLTLAACSDIAEDDRFEYVEPAEVAKRVLIEDFTGQNCLNCPKGASVIEQLIADYGEDNIIAVGLYGGDLGLPSTHPLSLTCDESQWYYDYWGIVGQPSAKVDRGETMQNPDIWPTVVREKIQQKAPVLLEASCNYDEASRNVEITVSADGLENINGKLQVWLTEDNIVSVQMLPGYVVDQNYVHNHVFRATVNAQAGDDISIAQGENVTRTFTYTVSEDWKPEDMSVVTFVFNDSGVLQAAKAPLIPKAEEPGTGEGGESEGGDAAE